MRRFTCRGLCSTLFLLVVAAPSWGQSPSCFDPIEIPGRCLPWGFVNLVSQLGAFPVIDLSRDGTTVVGTDGSSVFRWDLERIEVGAQVMNLAGDAIVQDLWPVVSADGRIITGTHNPMTGNDRVFRWDSVADTILILPIGSADAIEDIFPSETNGTVVPINVASISGDGNTITGWGDAFNGDGEFVTQSWPFRWTDNGGTNDAPQLDFSARFFSWAVAGNGIDVVGFLNVFNPSFSEEAVVWSPTGGGTNLGMPMHSRSTAVSYDGQIVAGQRSDAGANGRAFRWTQSTGPQDIVSRFFPRAMSDDGNVIAGHKLDLVVPWVWDDVEGSQSLVDHFVNFGIVPPEPSAATPIALVSGNGDVFSVQGDQWVAKLSPLQVVALGDSYSSGEGAIGPGEQYRTGTDTDGPPENRCHRSNSAYAAVLRPPTSLSSYREIQEVAGAATGFIWDFIACSGATTFNVISSGEGQYGEGPQLAQDEITADTDLVTITIGGNDALFSAVVTDCVFQIDCFDELAPGDSRTWREYLTEEIPNRIKDDVTEVYNEIKSESEGNATVVALGYPLLISGDNGCLGAPFIGADERSFMRQMGMLLNETLAQAAKDAGIHFVPVAADFEGHNVCDSAPWIKGVGAEQRSHFFHPNVAGQAAYARALEEYFLRVLSLGYERGFSESGMPRNPM